MADLLRTIRGECGPESSPLSRWESGDPVTPARVAPGAPAASRPSVAELQAVLERLEGRPYPAYRDLRGMAFEVDGQRLCFEHVQADPFAAPSRLRVDIVPGRFALPARAFASSDARRASADFFHRVLRDRMGQPRGHGAFLEVGA